jgi:hypothetical protein
MAELSYMISGLWLSMRGSYVHQTFRYDDADSSYSQRGDIDMTNFICLKYASIIALDLSPFFCLC